MTRPEQAIVLVASPSDLEPERNRLEEVIRELNLSWSHSLGVRLELVCWETHGYPGVGDDPQDVLNRELPDDPDIFIGVMWSRFGTATGRAGSGTEEEFNRALQRYRHDPDSVVARIEVELPLFRDTLRKGADAAAQAVLISSTLNSTNTGSASEARQQLIGFRDSLIHAHNGIESFKNSVQDLPRMTSVLNAAKRETARVLQDQLDSMAEGRRIVTETIRSLDAILGNRPTEST